MEVIFKSPSSYIELQNLINSYVCKSDSLAVQCGHFLLAADFGGENIVPIIDEELPLGICEDFRVRVGRFPLISYQIGAKLLSNIQVPTKKLLTVVNDWQFPPRGSDRFDFYRQHAGLFSSYQEISEGHNLSHLSPADIGYSPKTGIWFSEMSLRNSYKRQLQKLQKANKQKTNFQEILKNGNIPANSNDTGQTEINWLCNANLQATCAQEIVELLRQILLVAQFTVFINIYPLQCRLHMANASAIFNKLYANNKSKCIIHIGLPSTDVPNEREIWRGSDVMICIR